MTSLATVDSIYTCAEAGGVLESQPEVTLEKGVGILGDRYARGAGTYSVLKGSKALGPDAPEPGRQVTLISADEVDAALDRAGMTLQNYGSIRRNIVVRGLPLPTIDTIGKALRLGDSVLLFVHRHCVPCVYNEKKNGISGLREAIWDEAGVNCEVLQGGHLQVGDTVQVLTDEELKTALGQGETLPVTDPGYKPPGFFLRPKEKSAQMIRQGVEGRKNAFKRYQETDPEGAARAQRSFASVGLSFWPTSCYDTPSTTPPVADTPSAGYSDSGAEPTADKGSKEEESDNQPTSHEQKSSMEAFEIDQEDGEEPNILEQISQDVDDLDEEAQGLLASGPPKKKKDKFFCFCCGPIEKIGNCTVFSPTTFARSGWGIMGPHWFGPPCVAGVLLSASSYFIKHAYNRIGPITTGICIFWTIGIVGLLANASYRNPGIVRPGQETPTRQHRWCELCKAYQPPKGAHCPDCNVCIAGFDHHCVWMGCCIGKSNLRQFTLFNISWLLYLAYCVTWVATLGPLIYRKRHK